MKYKVGDKVKIRENLVAGETYNGIYFSKGCNEFKGKESAIEDIYSDCYYLELTDEYSFTDDMLEPVEDTLMVRCIDNEDFEDRLTIGKIYEVMNISDADEFYSLTNDLMMEDMNYLKDRFEIVKEDKQVNKYTFQEVINNIQDGEEYKNTSKIYALQSIKKEESRILLKISDKQDKIGIPSELLFTKVEPKKYSFLEAWKAQEEGIEVVSSTGWHYKDNKLTLDGIYDSAIRLTDREILGKWKILD